jgi:hypothetical protein
MIVELRLGMDIRCRINTESSLINLYSEKAYDQSVKVVQFGLARMNRYDMTVDYS